MLLALHRRLAVAAAVLAFLALGAAYARAVPPWEAPDEPWHAAYAMAVADGRLPSAAETYEYHHPPLAYAWSALGIRIARIRPGGLAVGEANPRYPFAAAALAHPPGDPRVGRVRFLRTWGALAAALAVAMTFAAARAAGASRWGGVAATAAIAVWPQFVFTGHTVSNDGLATVAGAMVAYSAVHVLAGWVARRAEGRRPRRAGLTASAGAAVAVLTKLNAAVLVPVIVLAAVAAVAAAVRDPRRRAAGARTAAGAVAGSLGAVAALAVVAPGAIDALASQVMARAGRGAASLPAGFAADTLASLWARFGWANVDLPPVLLVPVAAVVVAAFAGLPRAVRRPRGGAPLVAAGSIVGASAAAFALSALADPQPQGRLLLPALPALAIVLAAGWSSLPRRGVRLAVGGAAVAGIVASHVAALGVVLPRAYPLEAPEPGVTFVRHLPSPWRVVAVLAAGASVAQPSVADRDGLVRVEVPIVVREPGTVRLRLTRPQGDGEAVGSSETAAAKAPAAGATTPASSSDRAGREAPADVVGEAVLRVGVTRARPWFGEARVRPMWVSVPVSTGAGGAVRGGDALTLEVKAADGAVIALWGGAGEPWEALRGADGGSASGAGGEARAVRLMRIEAYR